MPTKELPSGATPPQHHYPTAALPTNPYDCSSSPSYDMHGMGQQSIATTQIDQNYSMPRTEYLDPQVNPSNMPKTEYFPANYQPQTLNTGSEPPKTRIPSS